MRRSAGLFALLMAVLLLVVSAALGWRAASEIRQFNAYQQSLIEKQAALTAQSVAVFIDSLRNRMIAVSLDDVWLKPMEAFATQEAMQQALQARFKLYFPEMSGFSLANEQGEVLWSDLDLFISEACRTDLEKSAQMLSLQSGYFDYSPYLHAKPGDYHFDMIFPVLWNSKKLVFFMSFKAERLVKLLKTQRISEHDSFLLRVDKPGLIEVSAEQVREGLSRPFFLGEEEWARVGARVAVKHTQWEVAVIENPAVKALFWNHTLRESVVVWAVFAALWSALLWFGVTHERRQGHLFNKLNHLSMHDELTGLANRRMLVRRMQQALEALRNSAVQSGLLYIDLNDFKPVNDRYGHDIGDHLLKQVAERLQSCSRSQDLVARLGGDEFVVLLLNLAGTPEEAQQKLQETAERYRQRLSEPYRVDGHELLCLPSVGGVLMAQQVHDVDEILKQGDAAMYLHKQAVKAQHCEQL